MTLWHAPPPSLEGRPPNPQGWRGATGGQTRKQRAHLIAIAADRRREIDEGSGLHELWSKLYFGWERCGWSALYRNDHTGTVVGLPDHCDKALCPYDEQRRVAVLRDRYRARHDAALGGRRLYLAVLTVPNVGPGRLAAEFDRLRDAIGKLRRRKWWSAAVAGGLWRLEVTVNLDDGTWHPHVNLLFETNEPIRMAEWQPLIQAEWRRVLGKPDQQWVWLMPGWDGALPEAVKRQVAQSRSGTIPSAADGASSMAYTVKANKPDWINAADPAWVVEYIEGQAGRRSVSSFGAWRGQAADELDEDERTDEPTVEAPYASFGDPYARRHLPLFDPTLPLAGHLPAAWTFVGHGPRWALRKQAPLEEGRRAWLVWQEADGTQHPADADEDAITYQPRLLPRAGPPMQEDDMPLPSEYRRALGNHADANRTELQAPAHAASGLDVAFDRYIAEPCPAEPPAGARRGRCSACGGGVALPRAGVATWSAVPIVCAICAA